MSDDATPTPEPTEPQQGDPAALGDPGKAALKAERERASAAETALKALQKQYEQATAKVTEFEQFQQTAAQQLAERDLALTRLNVAYDKGLPKELAARLQGADEAALQADADQLLKLFPQQPAPTSPRPDPSQGPKAPGADSPESQFAAFMGPLLNH